MTQNNSKMTILTPYPFSNIRDEISIFLSVPVGNSYGMDQKFKCECGALFTRKNNLGRHKKMLFNCRLLKLLPENVDEIRKGTPSGLPPIDEKDIKKIEK